MLFERMMRAARLDSNLYEEVEHDLNASITLREVLNAQWGGFNALASRATGLTDGNTTEIVEGLPEGANVVVRAGEAVQ